MVPESFTTVGDRMGGIGQIQDHLVELTRHTGDRRRVQSSGPQISYYRNKIALMGYAEYLKIASISQVDH